MTEDQAGYLVESGDEEPIVQKEEAMTPKLLEALFVDEELQPEHLEFAQVVVQAWPGTAPRWLQMLANGNPERLEKVRKLVVEEFCCEQLRKLGFEVRLS